MKRNIFSVRNAAITAAFAIAGSAAFPAPITYEGFAYTPGVPLNGQSTWSNVGGTPDEITVGASSLSYPGMPTSTGGSIDITQAETEDIIGNFTPQTGTFQIYASAIVTFTSLPTTATNGNYWVAFGQPSTFVSYFCRVYARTSAGQVQLGIRPDGAAAITFAPTTFATGTSHFIVMWLVVNAGAGNDQSFLFIDPPIGAGQPAPTVTAVLGTDSGAPGIGCITFRQALSAGEGMGAIQIDEARVGTAWSDVAGNPFANVDTWTLY